MNKWAVLLGAVAAVGAAIAVGVALARRAEADRAQQIPDVIADCFDRIHRIEAEIQRLRALPEPQH